MIKTEFFNDFVEYYNRAGKLQSKNLLLADTNLKVADPIMDNITIYDTVNRRHAGFSKALEDVHGVRVRKDLKRYGTYDLEIHDYHFVHLVHRFTGSGASFQPTFLPDGTRNIEEHGYKNNHIEQLCQLGQMQPMIDYLVRCTKPMVTSVGNQPPSIKNGDPEKYRLAQQFYYDNFGSEFIQSYLNYIVNNFHDTGKPLGIKEAVDYSCAWHKQHGFKQWHFVLTAFVMDTAEYYPTLVDPTSHCYYGANCIKSFELIFDRESGDPRKNDYYEKCMAELCQAVGGRPYDVEDVCCDYIRYIKEYVPKGYGHLSTEETKNNSTLKLNGVYPQNIQDRIDHVLGGKDENSSN